MPNEVLVEGGARLRAVRKERGYTQEQLAELTKLSTRHIAGIEKGEANPSFEVLYTITSVLGVSFDAIFNPQNRQINGRVFVETAQFLADYCYISQVGVAFFRQIS